MKIILDAMGGDNAPEAVVKGAVQACREFGEEIILVGREAEVKKCLAELGEEKEENIKFSTLLYDFTYDVGDAVKDGKTATVPVTIKTYPIGKTYAASENPRADVVALEKKGQTETWKITLTLTKANGEWTVDPLTDEAKNALSGGLYEVLNS